MILFFSDFSGITIDGESTAGLRPASLPSIVHSGEERPAGRGAEYWSVVVGELDALGGEAVEVRCLDHLLPVGPE